MCNVKVPFLFVNPKSYLYGKESLALALETDRICDERGVMIFYTCPYADLRMIAEKTSHIVVTAQNMDALRPGRGMGAVLPESLAEAGAGAVVLNHAENPKGLSELNECLKRARQLKLMTIVCADSTREARAAAELGADIILAEPTDLIGTGRPASTDYIVESTKAIKEVNPNTKVMIASGITTPEDCYKVIYCGADGTGSTSGIVKAPDPAKRVEEMAAAVLKAAQERETEKEGEEL